MSASKTYQRPFGAAYWLMGFAAAQPIYKLRGWDIAALTGLSRITLRFIRATGPTPLYAAFFSRSDFHWPMLARPFIRAR